MIRAARAEIIILLYLYHLLSRGAIATFIAIKLIAIGRVSPFFLQAIASLDPWINLFILKYQGLFFQD